MATHLDYTVLFKDNSANASHTLHQGIEREVALEYVATYMPDYKNGADVTLATPKEIAQFARIAAERYPITVATEYSVFEEVPSFDFHSHNTDEEYVALFLPAVRQSLFAHDDKGVEQFYYDRYAALFNQGKALFGAQLKNIDVIQFHLDW